MIIRNYSFTLIPSHQTFKTAYRTAHVYEHAEYPKTCVRMQTFQVPETRVKVQFENGSSTFQTLPVTPGFDIGVKVLTKDGSVGVYVRPVLAPHLYPVTMTWTLTIGRKPWSALTHTFSDPQSEFWGHSDVATTRDLQDVGGTFLTVAIAVSSIVLPAAKVLAESARVAATPAKVAASLPETPAESSESENPYFRGGAGLGCGCDHGDSP
jgi:hypothetical protein